MNIKRQLVSGDYLKALAILKAAVVTWPDYEMFASVRVEQAENAEATDALEEEEGEDGYLSLGIQYWIISVSLLLFNILKPCMYFRKEENGSGRKKEDIVNKEISLLKKIFLSKYSFHAEF